MIRITYTATRELVGMIESGDTVVLEFSASDITPGREVSRDVQQAIGGARETLHHYGRRTWSVTWPLLSGEDGDAAVQFLSSVEAGGAMTFEPYYVEGPSLALDFITPRHRVAEVFTVKLTDAGFAMSELGKVGGGGADDYRTVAFAVHEA